MTRWRSWLWLVALTLLPILLGAAWVMAAVLVLSLLCYREYARVTGLFREKTISAVVVLGTGLVTFAAVDHYDRLFDLHLRDAEKRDLVEYLKSL